MISSSSAPATTRNEAAANIFKKKSINNPQQQQPQQQQQQKTNEKESEYFVRRLPAIIMHSSNNNINNNNSTLFSPTSLSIIHSSNGNQNSNFQNSNTFLQPQPPPFSRLFKKIAKEDEEHEEIALREIAQTDDRILEQDDRKLLNAVVVLEEEEDNGEDEEANEETEENETTNNDRHLHRRRQSNSNNHQQQRQMSVFQTVSEVVNSPEYKSRTSSILLRYQGKGNRFDSFESKSTAKSSTTTTTTNKDNEEEEGNDEEKDTVPNLKNSRKLSDSVMMFDEENDANSDSMMNERRRRRRNRERRKDRVHKSLELPIVFTIDRDSSVATMTTTSSERKNNKKKSRGEEEGNNHMFENSSFIHHKLVKAKKSQQQQQQQQIEESAATTTTSSSSTTTINSPRVRQVLQSDFANLFFGMSATSRQKQSSGRMKEWAMKQSAAQSKKETRESDSKQVLLEELDKKAALYEKRKAWLLEQQKTDTKKRAEKRFVDKTKQEIKLAEIENLKLQQTREFEIKEQIEMNRIQALKSAQRHRAVERRIKSLEDFELVSQRKAEIDKSVVPIPLVPFHNVEVSSKEAAEDEDGGDDDALSAIQGRQTNFYLKRS